MNKLIPLIRILYGLIFVVFGLNGFTSLIPIPPMGEQANQFLKALIATGYMLPLWKSIEIFSGLALIFNFFTPAALLFLAPVVVNIFFFHVYLDKDHVWLGILLGLIHLFLMIKNKESFLPLLTLKKRTHD